MKCSNEVASSKSLKAKSYYPQVVKKSADDDFTCAVRKLWNRHVEQLPVEIVEGRKWGSTYWEAWYSAIDLSKAMLDDDQPQDICVAGSEDMEDVDGKDRKLVTCGGSRPAGDCGEYGIPATKAPHLTVACEVTDSAVDAPLVEDPDTARGPDTADAKSTAGFASWEEYHQHRQGEQRKQQEAWDKIDEQQTPGGCCAFGEAHYPDHDHNVEIARMIDMLGSNSAGRKAVVDAIAKQQGINDQDEVARIYNGTSDRKLRVPPGWRAALTAIGLQDVMAPVNILTTRDSDSIYVTGEAWQDMEFEVALDSGSVVHVCSLEDCKGYKLGESPGSRRGQEFSMGDGGTIPNLGQATLNLTDAGADRDLQSTFQIAAVTRPLMSVGKICDTGHTVTFSDVMAVVHAKDGSELARFHREYSSHQP